MLLPVKVQDVVLPVKVQDVVLPVKVQDMYVTLFVIVILCSCLWTTQIHPLYWSSYHKDPVLVTIPLLMIVS